MSNELTTTHKRSLIVTMANKYSMDPAAFQSTIKSTVMPSKATNEQMAAFLLVANEYDLNPITREIHAFPAQGGGVTPVVGIDGWVNLAQRREEFDGMEFDYEHGDNDKVVSCTCRIYRKDRTRPVEVTEFMNECARSTSPWKSHPRRMLRHKAVIQAIRYAFGFSGIKDEDDAELMAMPAVPTSKTVEDLRAGTIEHQPAATKWPKQITDHETGEEFWQDSRGIAHNPTVHGMTANGIPAVTKAGHFTRRRGCDAKEHARIEAEALAELNGHQDTQQDNEAQPGGQTEEAARNGVQEARAPTYPEVMHAIQTARDAEGLAAAKDLLNGFAGPQEQRNELSEAIGQVRSWPAEQEVTEF